MGLASYGQPRFADTFVDDGALREGRLRNDNSWFYFHTRRRHVLLPAFRRDVRSRRARTKDHVDAEPYRDIAASGQKVLEQRAHSRSPVWCRDGTGERPPVHGRRRGAECRRQRPPRRAADLQEHLGSARRQRRGLRARHPVPHLARTARAPARLRDGARLLGPGVSRVGHAAGHSVARSRVAACGRRGASRPPGSWPTVR